MWYRLLRPFLFLLPPELAHRCTLFVLRCCYPKWRVENLRARDRQLPKTLLGMTFPNPIGIAAGLDKNAEALDALWGLGCGFVEIGAVTPRPQAGNAQPRLFRLISSQALINRFGFNNRGLDFVVAQLQRRRVSGIVGVNIGKNADTPLSEAAADYQQCYTRVYPYADFVTVNVSSPNTQALRGLQEQATLTQLLSVLKATQAELTARFQRHVPIFVKISPDLDDAALVALIEVLLSLQIEGVIAVNTTVARDAVAGEAEAQQVGGLSGKPLFARALQIVERVAQLSQGRLVIIGVGGIASPEDARRLLAAGADLLQLYTALVYQGPGLIRRLINRL